MSVIDIDWSFFVLTEFIESKKGQLSGKTCLDIGSGSGLHAKGLRTAGLEVTTLDKYALTADIKQGFMEYDFEQQFDYIFCSHVIEHQRNCGLFLDKIFDVLSDKGILILSAPKHAAEAMVEGHINSFVLPLLIQQMIYSGFDLKSGKLLSCGGVENSIIAPKDPGYSTDERLDDAYEWREHHKARSPVELLNQNFINEATFFYNCEHWFVNSEKQPFFRGSDKNHLGLTIMTSRWGASADL